MIYNAYDALEDCRALASLIDHDHGPHHITTDDSFILTVWSNKFTHQNFNQIKQIRPILKPSFWIYI